MANGIEDLREKNKGRENQFVKGYSNWAKKTGREDAEMLVEKKSQWRPSNRKRRDYGED